MKNLEFPVIGTKVKGINEVFNIESPAGRKRYFQAKAGDEIAHIRKYLKKNTFVAYFLGKKSSGKGTYSKLVTEIFGEDKIEHISVGDLIREIDDWKKFVKTEKYQRMKSYYRGYVSFDEAISAHLGRSTTKLLPTEFILALLKAHIDDLPGKSIFIDGLPRNLDQISYSLYFRDLINYRNDPDFFVLIDIPEAVIEERMKYRRVCPKCQTSRNLKLLPTSNIQYDIQNDRYYLVCDNPSCEGAKMIAKEGDDKGLAPIRERLNRDEELIKEAFKLYGIPKILLRNHIPVFESKKFDNYEITPQFDYVLGKKGKVVVKESPWVVKDDNGVDSHSLMAPAVIITMLRQMVEIIGL
jgi:adenylate kinase family enzyme